jgi:RNA-directed DNA polymerase
MCRTQSQANEAMHRLEIIMDRLRLKLHPEKTRTVELGLDSGGFDFLGCHLRIVRSAFRGRTYLFRWPSQKAMKRVRERIRELTDRRRRSGMKDIRDVIRDLNPVLRGWGNYFRTGNASLRFQQIDLYTRRRLVRLMAKRGGVRRRPFRLREWPHERFVKDHGLYRLLGTIRYPGGAKTA